MRTTQKPSRLFEPIGAPGPAPYPAYRDLPPDRPNLKATSAQRSVCGDSDATAQGRTWPGVELFWRERRAAVVLRLCRRRRPTRCRRPPLPPHDPPNPLQPPTGPTPGRPAGHSSSCHENIAFASPPALIRGLSTGSRRSRAGGGT
jgi:hypothetical protein